MKMHQFLEEYFWKPGALRISNMVLRGAHLVNTWWLPGDYLVTTWWLLGEHLVATWWLLGECLVTTWWLLGDYLVTSWWPHGFLNKQSPCELLQNKSILKVLRKLNLGRWHKLSDSDNLWQFLTRFESGRRVSDTRFESGRRGSDSNCISSLHSQYIHFHWHHSRLENEMSLWWPVQTIAKQIFMPQFWRKATKLAALEIAMSRIFGQIISREVLKC